MEIFLFQTDLRKLDPSCKMIKAFGNDLEEKTLTNRQITRLISYLEFFLREKSLSYSQVNMVISF